MDSSHWIKVTAVHPRAHAVDGVSLRNGQRFTGVPVLSSSFVSSDSGTVDLHEPDPGQELYDLQPTAGRDVYAAVAVIGGTPAVIGFKAPEIGAMTFDRKNFRLQRHASGFYVSTNGEGDMEMFHPNGTFLRIAQTVAHEDLTGQDYDKRFKVDKNTDKVVRIYMAVYANGEKKVDFHLTPTGDLLASGIGKLEAIFAGDIHLKGANVLIESTGTMTLNAAGASTIRGSTIDLNP